MRFTFLIADCDLNRIRKLGHTHIIERVGEAVSPPPLARVEEWLVNAGAVPMGYRVAGIKELE